jgi:hypothetical protein
MIQQIVNFNEKMLLSLKAHYSFRRECRDVDKKEDKEFEKFQYSVLFELVSL